MEEIVLDARNLLCPLPVIRTQNTVKLLAKGDHLRVLCTDPGAAHDIPAWCRINGHHVVELIQRDDEIAIVVRVGATAPA